MVIQAAAPVPAAMNGMASDKGPKRRRKRSPIGRRWKRRKPIQAATAGTTVHSTTDGKWE